MKQTALKNRMEGMIAGVVFCIALGTTILAQAADKVVVIPMGKSGAPVPVAKTGQMTSSVPGDDGNLQKGVSMTGRFKDNGNGTVTDGLTGLIWLKDGQCGTFFSGDTGTNPRPWLDAITAANKLASPYCTLSDGSVAGDWRLPNRRELDSLVDFGQDGVSSPALPTGCPLTDSTAMSFGYWSSTTYAGYSLSAWYVHFVDGGGYTNSKSQTHYVRAVRGGQ